MKTVFFPLLEAACAPADDEAAEPTALVTEAGVTGVLPPPPAAIGELVAVVVSGPAGSGLGMTTRRGCSLIIAAAAARLMADKFGGCGEKEA